MESGSTDTMACLTGISKLCPQDWDFKDHLAVSCLGDPIFKNQEFWFDYLRPEEDHEEEPWDRNETFHNLDGALTQPNFQGVFLKTSFFQVREMLVFYHGDGLKNSLKMWMMGSTKIKLGSPKT